MRIDKKTTLPAAILTLLLGVGIWHEIVSIKISQPGYYSGVVVDKAISPGRSSTFYIYADWEGLGLDDISVHPITYKHTNIGDTIYAQYSYIPILGAAGMAYAPGDPDYSIRFAIIAIFSKICAFLIICYLGYMRFKDT